MGNLLRAAIEAAAARLRGQIVATPLLGVSWLPALDLETEVRVKAETLQPGRSAFYRGILHALLCVRGEPSGMILHGRGVLSGACAARELRLPVVAFLPAADADLAAVLDQLGCPWAVVADVPAAVAAEQRRAGFLPMPVSGEEAYDLGMATIGLELATQLPRTCERVICWHEAEMAVASGLRAGGHGAAAIGVSTAVAGLSSMRALQRLHGLSGSAVDEAIFAQALAGSGQVAAVLGW